MVEFCGLTITYTGKGQPVLFLQALVLLLQALATIGAAIAVSRCDFVKVSALEFDERDPGRDNFKLGFFEHEEMNMGDHAPCVRWTEEEIDEYWDSNWKMALAAGVISGYIGISAFLLAILCWNFRPLLFWDVSIFTNFLLGMFSWLMLVTYKSELCNENGRHCELGTGKVMSIVAGFFYLGAATVAIVSASYYKPPERQLNDSHVEMDIPEAVTGFDLGPGVAALISSGVNPPESAQNMNEEHKKSANKMEFLEVIKEDFA